MIDWLGFGELFAILAAIVWALSTILYKGFSHHLTPMQLNISKGVLASAMMLATIAITQDAALPHHLTSWLWLIAGGMIGIAIGDSAYFTALRNIGPARTLVIESLAPALVGVFNILLLNHYLSPFAWCGIVLTTIGVVIAIKPEKTLPQVDHQHYRKGVLCALAAAICQALGMVMSKGALNNEHMSSLWAALIRLAAGTMTVALVVAVFKSSEFKQALTLRGISGKQWFFAAVFLGTFLGLWLQLGAVKYTDPAIAQTIFATAPLIVMSIGFIKREPVTNKMLIGGLLALIGVGVLLAN
ncbi:DMT family transporter [Pseudoalteromonas sp. SG41-5]|uniref:DMT family transporter n=1 Tax=Pseudoalteromonas sp. SG41-5 TaxID=2760975 RepID=UPI0015FEC225|nr:DMT family transporter [Pseudoalteromonas sp. SG41-5]MBB1469468.1 DMT family transporter [Pseudoalteromonas sp. SG41-5]